MTDELRFLLLSELVFEEKIDMRSHRKDFEESNAYKMLSYNIISAKNCQSRKAKSIVFSYENLNLEPRSIRDYFLIENALNYISLHSYPEYYLNPLTIDPNYEGEVNSIGDLIITYKGKDTSINEVILDDKETPDVKKEEIAGVLEYYQGDLEEILANSIAGFEKSERKNAGKDKRFYSSILDWFLLIASNFFAVFMVIFPFTSFQSLFMNPDFSLFSTYVMMFYPFITLFYDFIFLLYFAYKERQLEPYLYARRYLRLNGESIYQIIEDGKNKLYDYLCGAINNRIVLKNDITDFSLLSTSYLDISSIQNALKRTSSRLYKILYNIRFAFSCLMVAALIFSLVIYFLSYFLRSPL